MLCMLSFSFSPVNLTIAQRGLYGVEASYKPTNREFTQRRRQRQSENGKKAIGLDKQNNNFAPASRFFVHFSAIVAWLQCESV